jgi:hypothetical protein
MPDGLQTAVPGQEQVPGTPPFMQSQSGPTSGGVDEQTKRILAALTQAATQKRAAGTPHPVSLPGTANPMNPPSYMTSGPNPHAWGAERLMYGVQSMIRNAVNRQKEQQITKATADWEYAQSALNEYYAAQQSGDQEALKSAQGKLDVVFGDPKKLKLMAKALNQDWLNPDKTTVHGEALKRVAAETQQKDQQKQQAKGGIQKIFKSLIDKVKGQQTQYTPDEQKKMEQEIINKAPTTTGVFDIKQVNELSTLEKTLVEARQKYQYIPAADGSIWAVNKNDRSDAHQLRDTDTGEAVKGKTAAKEGQVYMANGMPAGVFHAGKPVMPGDPEWKPEDQKMFDVAVNGAKEKQFLRVDPAIAAMVGDPPDPGKFKGGRSDPEYGKELTTWGKAVFAKQEEKAAISGEARAKAFNEYRPVQAMDADGNVFYTTAKKAIEQGMAGAGEGIKLKPREAQINDIQVASQKTREAINALDKKFTPDQIAKLYYAMSSEDPTLANTELSTLATQNLTEKQQDFVIWARQLNERAMSLRNVAGMGAGAQDLRTAIRSMIPGIRSGSKEMMNKQLDAFDNQVKILKTGIAHPGKAAGIGSFSVTAGGKTYTFKDQKSLDSFKKEAKIP